ncbi:MAG: acetate--CoA ligase family protein [Caldisphaeraceae archaeon]|nr:acetate--CoA ligase family protein [Caldisphaeraceae archaeon]MEB2793605.1 acetate--CoA ligase family protein [Caldisphaeraceae archaeon]MEB3692264.1 acetate--CoA ligase family protein [Caldisphaeraceae archaeon]MEB3798313.1 acetate--CoA ligase family protein [Caldisphaeraceae archaeon]
MQRTPIDVFFEPKSVAVVGASPREGSLGRAILENISRNYKGSVYAVNPRHEKILGIRSYPSLSSIDGEVDIAVIAIDASRVPSVIEDAGRKKVKGVIIVSGGFAETGTQEGERLQKEVIDIATKYNIRVLGPNCIGIFNSYNGIDTFFLPYEKMRRPKRGNISIISQSGALLATLMDWVASKNIRIGKAINFGNKVDVGEIESMDYFARDKETKVILMYLEGITPGSGPAFIETAKKVTSVYKKPIILVKGGKTSGGAKAAKSHTASLAGSYEIFKAAAKQSNIIIAKDLEELFDIAKVIASNNLPLGNRVAVITNSGGHGVISTDTLVENGLVMAEISQETKEKLRQLFPSRVSINNPIDFTGDARPAYYEEILDLLANNNEADLFLVVALVQPPTMDLSIGDLIYGFTKKHPEKPIAVVTIGSKYGERLKRMLERKGIPTFEFPDRASKALAVLYKFRKSLEANYDDCYRENLSKAALVSSRKIITNALNDGRSKLLENEALDLLEAFGIGIAKYCMISDPKEFKTCAKDLNYPVAMKVVSRDVIHKTEAGGVLLDINNENEVMEGYKRIVESVKHNVPNARIEGVIVQEMVKKGQEIIIGGKRDEVFGPVVLFGLGGIYTEVLGDVTMGISPITSCDALNMVNGIKSVKILNGYRGFEPVNKVALAKYVMRVSELMLANPEIKEIDINPLIAYKEGAVAVDARIILEGG